MLTPQYEEGNLVKVCYGAVYELAKIKKDTNGQLVAVPVRNKVNNAILVNNLTNSCIHGFILTMDIMRLLGANWQNAGYDLGGGWYELVLADSQQNNTCTRKNDHPESHNKQLIYRNTEKVQIYKPGKKVSAV